MNIFEFIKMLFASKLFIFLVCLVSLILIALVRAIYNDYFDKH